MRPALTLTLLAQRAVEAERRVRRAQTLLLKEQAVKLAQNIL